MKKFFTIALTVFLSVSVWSQAPQKFSYQAVIRTENNALVVNKMVGIRISILQGSEVGSSVYSEIHTPTSNANGLVTLNIGTGKVVAGEFTKIDWSKSPYFLKTETDVDGGTNYQLITVNEFMSVPYALYATNSQPGPKGDTGEKGEKGEQGPAGKDGINGADGKDGVQGPKGDQGEKGEQGPAGKDGMNGVDGKDGVQGPKGDQGEKGEQGPAGKDGINGADGKDGIQGPKGDQGEKGEQGPAGKDGINGADGKDGIQGPKGDQGEKGEQGPAGKDGINGADGKDGAQGLKGDQGIQGLKGDKGDTGAQGPKGDLGEQGPQGLKGDKGDTGAQGLKGDQGIQGAKGDIGEQGPQGLKGDKGDTGSQGLKGDQGIQGPKGDIGEQGLQGLKGDKGDTGAQGLKGDQGIQGPKGDVGEQGPQGLKGDKGDTGAQGLKGDQGIQGPKGDIGEQGPQGLKGDKGDTGAQGLKGDQGIQGPAGKDGVNGVDGLQGPKGDQGLPGVNGLNTIVKSLPEPNGSNCLNGGVKLEYGNDADKNGVLDDIEINPSLTQYVCNGIAGQKGENGSFPSGNQLGEMNYWNGSNWVALAPGTNGQGLSICDGVPTWTTNGICPGKISSINCQDANHSGNLIVNQSANSVSSVISYTGGNGGNYNNFTVNSTGVLGLTAVLSQGMFSNGTGNLTLSINGTPASTGIATFNIVVAGKTCSLTRNITLPEASLSALNCSSAINNGSLFVNSLASSVNSDIPYSGGNGGTYANQSINSTGVLGLKAEILSGILSNGSGNLNVIISGTPSTSGTASFSISIGGQSCVLSRNVVLPVGTLSTINCSSAVNNGNLYANTAASSVTSVLSYSGGNGGTYGAFSITSTSVTGLTASIASGNFANGNGTLTFAITGTPSSIGTANFEINIGGVTCSLSRTVSLPLGTISTLTCSSAVNSGSLVKSTAASSVSSTIPYTGGNGGTHNGQTITSTGVSGLTATLTSGTFASGNGNLEYTITGTPSSGGTASFAINIGGKTCSLARNVDLPIGTISSIDCSTATNSGVLTANTVASGITSSISYSGGNEGTHSGQTVSSTGVTGLTATLAAGNFANGNGTLIYNISGTPSASGTASFEISIAGKTCGINLIVNEPIQLGTISSLNCGSITKTGNLFSGIAAEYVSFALGISGGNNGPYQAASYNSTGITGLTASLSSGYFWDGQGAPTQQNNYMYPPSNTNDLPALNFTISGTPSGVGTATFNIAIDGKTCSIALDVKQIATSGTNITDLAGNSYKTVNIGGQQWMAENLKNNKVKAWVYQNGTTTQTDYTIPYLTSVSNASSVSGPYCLYHPNDYQNVRGLLYNSAVINSSYSQLCPTGWRIPNQVDFAWLINYLGGEEVAGAKLKSFESWNNSYWSSSPGNTSISKFDAINSGFINVSSGGGGMYYPSQGGSASDYLSGWWYDNLSSPLNDVIQAMVVEGSSSKAYIYKSNASSQPSDYNSLQMNIGGKSYMSIRCIKDVSYDGYNSSKGLVYELQCGSATKNGSLAAGQTANQVTLTLPYKGGNGQSYPYTVVQSTGVSGLVASINSGTFNSSSGGGMPGSSMYGDGTLTFNISGIPSQTGDAIFHIYIGGKTCDVKIPISN